MLKSVIKRIFSNSGHHPLNAQKKERFTQRARHVMALAQEAAQAHGASIIESEYLLLGLLREEGGVARLVLCSFEPQVEKIDQAIMDLMPPAHSSPVDSIELAQNVKQILEYAVDEARRMGHHWIGTEHLLLGIVRQRNTIAVQALNQLGITPQTVREKIRAILAEKPAPQ